MDKHQKKTRLRLKRHGRVRRRVCGTPQRPRLCVFRSNKHMYAQVIDDSIGRTLVSACTQSPDLRAETPTGSTVDASAKVGDAIGRLCLENGITQVVFDRGGFKYCGRVKALANAARKRFTDAGAVGF